MVNRLDLQSSWFEKRECRGHGNRVSGLSRSRVRGGIAGHLRCSICSVRVI